jgi:enoyl-CoA hydratase/carnithine racemase
VVKAASSERRGFAGIEGGASPLIAAVAGKALGGGFEIALRDLIVASTDAQFATRGGFACSHRGGVTRLTWRSCRARSSSSSPPRSTPRAADLGLVSRRGAG